MIGEKEFLEIHKQSSLGKLHNNVALEYLIQREGYKKLAEIGVFRSHLCRNVLRESGGYLLDEYWAIDPWEVMPIGTYDRDKVAKKWWDNCPEARSTEEQWFEMYYYCCRLMTYFSQLKVVRMTSEQASTIFPDGYFDVVFIDAIHTYEGASADIGLWLPKVRKGGSLCGHDYAHPKYPGVKRAVDEHFGKDIETWTPRCNIWIKKI